MTIQRDLTFILQQPTYILLELHIILIFLIIYKPSTLIISPWIFSTQLGASTSLFCLFQCAIPFCTLSLVLKSFSADFQSETLLSCPSSPLQLPISLTPMTSATRLNQPEDVLRQRPCFDSRRKKNNLSTKPKERQNQQSGKDWRKRHRGKRRKRHERKRRNASKIWPIVLRQITSLPLKSNAARTGPRPFCFLQILPLTRR